ncbi:MAG: hypothetical protein ACR2NN_07910 [Bryobacteraceae bacterium]
MTAQVEDIDRKVKEAEAKFRGDVVRIRYSKGEDWMGDPALFFRILLSDDAASRDRLPEVSPRIQAYLFDELPVTRMEYFPYFSVRSKAEQDKLKDPEWD